jgi:hypothetical protein
MQCGNQPADISRINRRDLLVSLSSPKLNGARKREEKMMVVF